MKKYLRTLGMTAFLMVSCSMAASERAGDSTPSDSRAMHEKKLRELQVERQHSEVPTQDEVRFADQHDLCLCDASGKRVATIIFYSQGHDDDSGAQPLEVELKSQ